MTFAVRGTVARGAVAVAVDLEVGTGERVAIHGPNGAGKSTLLAVAMGTWRILDGEVWSGDVMLDDGSGTFVLPEARGFGVVFQDRRLFPHLSALENVAFGLRARGVDARGARRRAAAELEQFGVGAIAAARPGTLSGGQAQRVALARAFALDAPVMLLDEPFTAIDRESRAGLVTVVVDRLRTSEATALIATHSLTEAAAIADRALEISGARATIR